MAFTIEGSSHDKAMDLNKMALAEAEKALEELRNRAANGEIVDTEVKNLKAWIDKLKKDQGFINDAHYGMN